MTLTFEEEPKRLIKQSVHKDAAHHYQHGGEESNAAAYVHGNTHRTILRFLLLIHCCIRHSWNTQCVLSEAVYRMISVWVRTLVENNSCPSWW